MDSYTFRYLPVTVHLYGIPKPLRSIGLINKIIERIDVKDESVALFEDNMFKPHEFVLARIILDVKKLLLDSVIINIPQFKKIKMEGQKCVTNSSFPALPAPKEATQIQLQQNPNASLENFNQFQSLSNHALTEALNLNKEDPQFLQKGKGYKKSNFSSAPFSNTSQTRSNPISKRQGSPLVQPFTKKPLSPPLPLPPSPSPSEVHPEHSSCPKRRNGPQHSRWDREAHTITRDNTRSRPLQLEQDVSTENDPGGNSYIVAAPPHYQAQKQDDSMESDNASLSPSQVYSAATTAIIDGALAPALKAPQVP
ncbi:hypothetical protein PR202_ga22380 [Eleusine coracana subsp. coracana]|uniref:Uncharacterized protein n=1 Tax=Eleusine coracana subsp. coracana TaxID=191504 RepID=A0AAV5D3E3_ELECO|nr:hypothetical protein PR202_ga22380 [Eleusine coracana subsp. coracana]